MAPRAADRAASGRTLFDVAQSAAAAPTAIRSGQVEGVNKAALHVTSAIRDRIRAASGGDMRMSGVGRRGAKVSAFYKMYGGRVDPQAYIKASGPLPLLEFDTPPHVILPKGGRRSAKGRRLRGKKALKFGGGFYSRAVHPGTKGKHPFEKGWEASRADAPKILQKAVNESVKKAWF